MVQETLDLWEGTDSVLQAPIIGKWEEKVAFWNQQQWTKFRNRTVTNQVYCLVMRLRYDHFWRGTQNCKIQPRITILEIVNNWRTCSSSYGGYRTCILFELVSWRTSSIISISWVGLDLAEVADGFSKTAAWCILPKIFQQWYSEHHYTLGTDAALDERVHRTDGTPLRFCARSTHDESDGEGRTTSWQSHTVWNFPPPRVETLVLDAMQRCKSEHMSSIW